MVPQATIKNVNSVRLHFPNHEHVDLALQPGATGLGRDPDFDRGIAVVQPDQDAFIRIVVDRRGIWMTVSEGVWGVHVNGRPVQSLACLHVGDSLHVEGMEIVLTRESVSADAGDIDAGIDLDVLPVVPRPVLRGVSGPLHGQALPVSARDSYCPVIDLAAQSGLRMLDAGECIFVQASPETGTFEVNGLPVTEALLRSGDQLRLPGGQRLIVESPRTRASRAPLPEMDAVESPEPQAKHSENWSFLWILLSAVFIALVLLAVLWFGA